MIDADKNSYQIQMISYCLFVNILIRDQLVNVILIVCNCSLLTEKLSNWVKICLQWIYNCSLHNFSWYQMRLPPFSQSLTHQERLLNHLAVYSVLWLEKMYISERINSKVILKSVYITSWYLAPFPVFRSIQNTYTVK